MRRVRQILAFCGMLLILSGCGGDDVLGPASGVVVSGQFFNAEDQPTIIRIEMKYDGKTINIPLDADPPERAINVYGQGLGASLKGHHELTITVAKQANSPNTYRIQQLSVTYFTKILWSGTYAPPTDAVALPDRTLSLQTGESTVYTIDR